MAVAEQIQRIEIKMVEQEVLHEDVVLTLSKKEAQFVLNYLGHTVTGEGLRKHSDDICHALIKAGVRYSYDFPDNIAGSMQQNLFKGIKGGY